MRKLVWTAVLAVGAVALGGGVVISQEKDKKGGSAEGGMDPQMAEYMKLAQPGDHHKHLESMVGEWDVTGKIWMDPSSPPQEMKARSSMKAILGGRFVVEDFGESQMMGMPFAGHGIFGYDNMAKRHTGVWMDTMSTYVMFTSGACEGTGCKTVTLEGTFPDPKGDLYGWKGVSTSESKDKHSMVAYTIMPADMQLPEGAPREQKSMELTYTRRK